MGVKVLNAYKIRVYFMKAIHRFFSQFTGVMTHTGSWENTRLVSLGPLTPMNDQDRISPHKIPYISSTQVMRMKKKII